jgi:hypothetical protein
MKLKIDGQKLNSKQNKPRRKMKIQALMAIATVALTAYIFLEPLKNRYAQQKQHQSSYVYKSGKWNVVDLDAIKSDCYNQPKCVHAIFKTFPGAEDISLERIDIILKEET